MKILFKMAAFLCVILLACNDDQIETRSINPTMPNVVRFSSNEQFQELTDAVVNMSEGQFSEWEKKNSFTSYRSVLRQASLEWESLTSNEEQTEFLNRYDDILLLEDSVIVPRIDIVLYQSISNREGIYETNGFLNKVVGDFIVTVKADEYSKLSQIKSIDGSTINNFALKNGLKIYRFSGFNEDINARTKAACSTFMQASYFDNHSKCRDDREVFISAKSYVTLSTSGAGDLRQPRVQFKVWGTIRNWACNWSQYNTELEYRNVSFSIMAWSATGQPAIYSMNIPDYAPPGDRWDLPWDQPIGSPILNQLISANPFTSLHAEGSSRGVGNNWAVLNCP